MYGTSEQPVNLHPPTKKVRTTAAPEIVKPTESSKEKGEKGEDEKNKSDKSEENESWLPKFDSDVDIEEVIIHIMSAGIWPRN